MTRDFHLLYDERNTVYMREVRTLLFKKQDGRCAICHKFFPLKKLYIDHDHESGFVRGLLCNGCNTGLGCFQDNPAFIEFAKQYLIRHGKKQEHYQSSLLPPPITPTTTAWIDDETGKPF